MSDRRRSLPMPRLACDGWPLSWPAIGVLLALFVVLAILAGTIGTLPGDLWITHRIQRLQGQPWRMLWHIGNAFGTSVWVAGVGVLALAVAAARGWWDDVVFLIGVMLLRLAAVPVKVLVQSPRPSAAQALIVEPVTGYGFPSGHTLTATVLFGTIAVLLIRHARLPWAPRLAIGIWTIGVTITGFARAWSGAHWTSDVVGATLLGTALIAIAAKAKVSVSTGATGPGKTVEGEIRVGRRER